MIDNRLVVLCVTLVAAGAARGVDDITYTTRAEFANALAIVERGNVSDPSTDGETLRAYPLYPYLTAARLRQQMTDSTNDDAIREFVTSHIGEPVAFPLHRAWLASLAKRESWRELIDDYAQEVASTEAECAYLRARVELEETEGLAELIGRRWLTPTRLPADCEPAFEWLRHRGELDAARTEQRVRLLIDAEEFEFARVVARRLPEVAGARFEQWAAMAAEPIRAIDGVIAGDLRPDDEILSAVWTRAARLHPRDAATRFEDLRRTRGLDSATTSHFARELGLGLAWDRQPSSLREFGRVAERDLDDYALGWLTRAALWAGEWAAAARAIETMSAAARTRPIWRYWEGRSLTALDETPRARELYESIRSADNFYSAMAAARLGLRIEPSAIPVERVDRVLQSLESWPAIVRARELLALGHRIEATREWRFALQFLRPDEKQQAMLLASEWGWHDIAVSTATELGIFNHYDVLYPMPYAVEIDRASRTTQIADDVIYGLIRQESLFREDAASPTGALGLTQLLPSTARRTAVDRQQPAPRSTDLLEAEVSIDLGAATLRSLRDRFDGQLVVALAAYNAGPSAAQRWLPEAPLPSDVWVENIPFNETRDYVQRVIWHSLVYGWRRTGRGQDATAWLGTVGPRDD